MSNAIFGRFYSDEEIESLPGRPSSEAGVAIVSLPDGREAYAVPRFSENGRGWWGISYAGEQVQEMYLFPTLEEAVAERDGLNE